MKPKLNFLAMHTICMFDENMDPEKHTVNAAGSLINSASLGLIKTDSFR